MGVLCMKVGPIVYSNSKDLIMSGVRNNLERNSRKVSESSDASSSVPGEEEHEVIQFLLKYLTKRLI